MVLDATKELKWNWYMWLAAALLETEDLGVALLEERRP